MESMEAPSPAFQSPSRSRFTFIPSTFCFFFEVNESQKPLFWSSYSFGQSAIAFLPRRGSSPIQNGISQNFQLLKRTIWDSEIEILKIDAQETVVELLGVLGRRPWLPIVVCCSSRDELDAVCSSLSTLPFISFAALVLLSSSPSWFFFSDSLVFWYPWRI